MSDKPLEPWWTPEALRELREELYKESQRRFARRLLVALETYRSWEQGRKGIKGPTLLYLDRLKEDFVNRAVRPHPDDIAPKPIPSKFGKKKAKPPEQAEQRSRPANEAGRR